MILYGTVDFNTNQAKNLVFHNLPSSPANPLNGQTYYNTTTSRLMLYNGASWNDFSTPNTIAVDVVFGSTTPVTVLSLPVGYAVTRVVVNVTTAFNGTNPTLSLGIAGDVSKYFATTDVDLTAIASFPLEMNVVAVESEEIIIATYNAGSSTAGTAQILITYNKVS